MENYKLQRSRITKKFKTFKTFFKNLKLLKLFFIKFYILKINFNTHNNCVEKILTCNSGS